MTHWAEYDLHPYLKNLISEVSNPEFQLEVEYGRQPYQRVISAKNILDVDRGLGDRELQTFGQLVVAVLGHYPEQI